VNVLLCPLSDAGYLYPNIAVGLELAKRHHNVHVLARPDSAPMVAASGLPSLAADYYGERGTFSATFWCERSLQQYLAVVRAATDIDADVLITSVLCLGALLAAEVLDLPVIVIGFAAYLEEYRSGGGDEPVRPVHRAWMAREFARHYTQAREQVGLPRRGLRAGQSPLIGTALLLRGDPVLEYPGGVLPDRVYHVGPCAWEPPADPAVLGDIDEHLDRCGKPVVYVHLGRVFGGVTLWPWLNAAFARGQFQAVVEQGRTGEPRPDPEADILLVRKAWMGPLIDRAGLVVTNATSAPVLNSLLRGRPLAVAPNGSEQPLLSEACLRAGVAVRARIEDPATGGSVASEPAALLSRAWHDGGLRRRAQELGRRLSLAGGARQAADIVEAVTTPVSSVARSLA
jgi:UDP:flavonoid glycosyltransferase YjiC (YdhE family)